MNNFKTQTKLESKDKPILNDWDKKILFEGSKNVVDKLLKEFRGKLPDGIIYPDESARPLHYLFNEIFEKISKNLNQKKPRSFFIKIEKPDTYTSIMEDDEGRELYYDEAKEKFIDILKLEDLPARLNNYLISEFEKTHTKRAVEAERASEIEEYNEKLSDKGFIANLAVIDDFSNQGHTAKEINYAFGYEVPYFSVFGNIVENDVSGENMDLIIDRDTYIKNPTTDNSTKLSYTKHPLKKFIGINKNNIENKYSELNNNQTSEDKINMEKLRKEMSNIGKEIAEKY